MIQHRSTRMFIFTGIILGLSFIQFGCAPKPMKTAMVEQPVVTEEEATVEKHSEAGQPSMTSSAPVQPDLKGSLQPPASPQLSEPQTIIETKPIAEKAIVAETGAVPEKPASSEQIQLAAAPSSPETSAMTTVSAPKPSITSDSTAPQEKTVKRDVIQKTRYTVKPGDSLWWIARYKDVYNNAALWPVIYKSNEKKIKDPNRIFPGQTFDIPGKDAALKSFKKINRRSVAARPVLPPAQAKLPVK